MISTKNLVFSYEKDVVLDNINLTIEDGSFIGLVGENGVGKSTLVKLLLGLLKPTSGQVNNTFKKLGYVSQTMMNFDSSFPATVYEIISLGLINNKTIFFPNCKKEVDNILKELDIIHLQDRQMNSLSGGEQQKVKLAKALVSKPDIIFFDEPTTGFDSNSQTKMLELINKIHQQSNITIFYIAHNLKELKYATLVYEIKNHQLEIKNV